MRYHARVIGLMVAFATLPWERTTMSVGFWPAVVIVLLVIAWVLSKVIFYARKSEEQWQKVDKSKIKEWEDDEWE